MDIENLYRRTVESWTDRVKAVGPDQWESATPCTDWDVRALVNHVVGEDLWTEPLMRGQTIADVGDRLDGDLLGSDARETALDAAEQATKVVAETLPTGGKVHLSYGDEDMSEYLAQLAADHLIHGWDLAAATGGDTRLDADLVSGVAAWWADREELYRSAGAIGPRVEAGGDPQSDLLASFGRDPAWSASTS
jgi:uncharacterized protein (TIGR03086 family)